MRKTIQESPIGGDKSILVYLQEIFICFWVASVLGHYLEIVISYSNHLIFGGRLWMPTVQTVSPLAPPYGFGAMAVIIFVVPLIKKYKLNFVGVFILNVFVTGAIEYLCAAVIVTVAGRNRFWNYSHDLLNINGYVCLKSAVMFGIAATLFIYFVYPIFEKLFKVLSKKQFNFIFWLLFITYGAEVIGLIVQKKIF